MSVRDLIIVGAGPSGLSAAIAAKQRGLDYLVLEQGALVNSIYRFPPQMIFFTTPELLEIGGLPFVSPYEKPTRAEALKYYRKVVDTYDLQIAFDETVLSVEREEEGAGAAERAEEARKAGGVERAGAAGQTFFAVETRTSRASKSSGRPEPVEGRGVRRIRRGRYVVLAAGYYDHPNLIGVPGEDLPHVHHYYSEPHPYYRQRVIVVGGGNSAAEASLELFRSGVSVTLVHRWPELKPTIKYWVRPDIENRINEGSIPARFNTCVTEIRPTSVIVRSNGAGTGQAGVEDELASDAVFLLTGYHPDFDLLSRAGVALDDRGVPTHDADTFETNVSGLFVAGGCVSGKDTAPIFIENGRFHGEKIVEVVAARMGR